MGGKILLVIMGLALFGSISNCMGPDEPNVYEKYQSIWAAVPPADKDTICTAWVTEPNSTAAMLAPKFGNSTILAEDFLDFVC